MKILFLAAYSEVVAASRIKVYQFLPHLSERGVKYKVICFTPSFLYRLRLLSEKNKKFILLYYPLNYVVRSFKALLAIIMAPQFDIIFINEPIIPFAMEKLLKLVNKNIIFQFSDAVFLDSQLGDNTLDRIRSRILFTYWKRIVTIAKICLVDNDYSAKVTSEFCKNVEVMTGPIDTERYFFVNNRHAQDPIIIGWIGSPFTTKYLYEIKDALYEISQKYPVLLRLIGASKYVNIPNVNYEIIDWSLNSELLWLKTFDIGIAPLIDDKWVQGKASYKIFQYMAMGIPCVASAIGFHNKLVKDGYNGYLASSTSAWVQKLSQLINDKELREKIGKNARITVLENYSLSNAVDRLIKIFENVFTIQESKII